MNRLARRWLSFESILWSLGKWSNDVKATLSASLAAVSLVDRRPQIGRTVPRRMPFPAGLAWALNQLADNPDGRSPRAELNHLRTLINASRQRSAVNTAAALASGSAAEATDRVVVALLRYACSTVDWDADPQDVPIACVALNDLKSEDGTAAGTLLLLLERWGYRRGRGQAVAGFIAHGLSDLGIAITTVVVTVPQAAALLSREHRQPGMRLIAGRRKLFAELGRRVSSRVGQPIDSAG